MNSHRRFAYQGVLCLGLLLFLLIPVSVRADSVIFSNFGAGPGFDLTLGLAAPFGAAYEPNGIPDDVAVSFTPSSDTTLSQIVLALLWEHTFPPNSTTVELVNSVNGFPGTTVLESWSGLAIPSLTASPPVTLTSSPGVFLSGGTQYWIVVGTEGADFWLQNNSGETQTFDLGSGTSWTVIDTSPGSGYPVGTTSPAFEVTGAAPVPEPTTMSLLEFGLLGLGAFGLRARH